MSDTFPPVIASIRSGRVDMARRPIGPRARLFVVGWISAWFVIGSAVASPTPSSAPAVINVSAASASAPSIGSLLVTVDGLTASDVKKKKLLSAPRDIEDASAAAKVTFGEPVALVEGLSQRRWLLPFKVTDMAAGTTQTRYVAFKVGAVDWALPYQISSPALPAISWSLKPPPAGNRALQSGEGIPISIAVTGTVPLAGVSLMPFDLVEQVSRRPLANVQWRLCTTHTQCDDAPIAMLAAGPHSFWIMPTSGVDVPPGKYEGMVTIASVDKPLGESVSLTLNFSSIRVRFFGFIAILMGLALGFYVTTFLRRRMDRDQLLIGPAVLRDGVARLRLTLHADILAKTPEIDKKLDALDEALSEPNLELAGLPPRIPVPWPVSTDAYKQYVDLQTASLNALRAIVDTGVVPLLAARHDDEAKDGPLNASETVVFGDSMQKIDAIADWGAPLDPAAVPTTTTPIVQAFKDAIAKSRAHSAVRSAFVGGGATPSLSVAPLRTPEQLRIRITEGSLLAWVILGIVTATTGTYALVLSNPGFGTVLDLVGCLLWGAGLPAGAALAGSTTGTVSTALNVTR